jgi:hypothetical protein
MNKTKRIRSLVLAGLFILWGVGGFAQSVIDSGYCGASGNNLTWVLTSDSVLTISGSGEMAGYNYGAAPWHFYKESIVIVIIGDSLNQDFNKIFRIKISER